MIAPTGRCYECFRPQAACFCASIPRIDNRTNVLILQHRRERFHPFNTARIVRKALRNCQLMADHTCNLAKRLRLRPGAALLYPGPKAVPISDLPAEQQPEQLVILDGTWPNAKTVFRDIPALQALPRYGLAPVAPSRYRIRREPSATSLSTVEAAVAALQILEPQTDGLDLLLQAFDTMVDGQLAHSGSAAGQRFRKRRKQTFRNIPLALQGDLKNIVVAYGEAAAGERGQKRAEGPPVSWVARRMETGETFSCLLAPSRPLDDVFLGHLALTRADFAAALSLDEARRQWAKFQRPDDIVTVFHPGTARLFSYLAGERVVCLVLKSVDLDLHPSQMESEAVASSPELPTATRPSCGRAGQRLANDIAFVRHLNSLANTKVRREFDPTTPYD